MIDDSHIFSRLAAARVAGILLIMLSGGCTRAEAGRPPRHPERLDGAWTMEMRLDHPATLSHPTPSPVRGAIVLLENRQARKIAGVSGVPTHYGVYAADLRPLGLDDPDAIPALTARLVGADSVEIAFAPEDGHGFAGRGVLIGDSVTGRWWAAGGRAVPASTGRFILRRP